MNDKQEELSFPLACHFKVIGERRDRLRDDILQALDTQNINADVTQGNQSGKGTYVTYNFSVEVYSKEQMNAIDGALRAIPGVKMVL